MDASDDPSSHAAGRDDRPTRSPKSVRALETLGRVQLSPSFFMRDFLYSEVAAHHGLANVPERPDAAIAAGRRLCTDLLEPLQARFGRVAIRSGYRSPTLNAFCNQHGYACASNARNRARHIWDRPAEDGSGAVACVVLSRLVWDHRGTPPWQAIAWWIHDHLAYSELQFFPKLLAFNIGWHERPKRTIFSFAAPRGCLTRPGWDNHEGSHAEHYGDLPDGPIG